MCPKQMTAKRTTPHDGSSRPWIGSPLPPDIPLRDFKDLMHSHLRYIQAFQSPTEFQHRIPDTTVPGDADQAMFAWAIQAPLNSVEVLEAILQPAKPLCVYRARHVGPQTAPVASEQRFQKKANKHRFKRALALHREYKRFQGRLEKQDREVAFVCLSNSSVARLQEFYHTYYDVAHCSVVQAFYISLPWYNCNKKSVIHPWITVHRAYPPVPGLPVNPAKRYNENLRRLLRTLGLATDCAFERSLLEPGEEPLPENLLDWFRGIPGSTAALPYYKTEHREIKEESTSTPTDLHAQGTEQD